MVTVSTFSTWCFLASAGVDMSLASSVVRGILPVGVDVAGNELVYAQSGGVRQGMDGAQHTETTG
jgi:hypothetical protein